MPYGMLDESINDLSAQRTCITLLACGSILLFLTLIFLRYFFLTRQQLLVILHRFARLERQS